MCRQRQQRLKKMAEFKPAYLLERKHEGYYVNNPNDKGGETYAGVARNIYPNWNGWPILDAHKATIGRALKTNEQVPNMEPFVEAFYRSLWDQKNFGAIQNQDVANIVYDFFINSGSSGIRKTQEVLRDSFQQAIVVDGVFGADTLAKINAQDPVLLNNAIKEKRIAFYNSLVAKDATQSVFLKGWLSRINSFPTLTKAGIGLAALATAVGLFFLGKYLIDRKKKTKKKSL